MGEYKDRKPQRHNDYNRWQGIRPPHPYEVAHLISQMIRSLACTPKQLHQRLHIIHAPPHTDRGSFRILAKAMYFSKSHLWNKILMLHMYMYVVMIQVQV